jgi:hypothetical protein
MTSPSLHAQLHRFGRRVLIVGLLAGVAWALAAAILLAVAGAWLDLLWELSPVGRLVCLAASTIGAVGVVVSAAWLVTRRRQPRELARRLDHAAGTGGEILTGVDLLLDRPPSSPLTGGLAMLAVERAGTVAGEVDGKRAVPGKPLVRAGGSAIGLAVAIALVAVFAPRLAGTQWLRFTDPYGDHPPYSRVVFHIKIKPDDHRVVYGGGFDIAVTTEGPPVEKLSLVLENGSGEEPLPMFPEPNGGWRATVASVTAPGKYFVRAHAGRSQKFAIDVITVPLIEVVRFRITPPAYTNRPAYDGPLPPGGITGLPGTHVQVWAKSNRPLGENGMSVPGGDVTMMPTSAGASEAAADFTIRAPGRLRFALTDTEGQRSTTTFEAPIDVLTDERPFVRLLEPPPTSMATPEAAVPVVIAAEDDYGLTRVQLYRSLNDSRGMPLDVPLKLPPPTRWQDRVVLPLSAYGLQPGDEIKLFARVEDNDPAGPKGAESTIVTIRIVAQAEFEKMLRAREGLELLQSKYQQAQRRMEDLADQADRLEKQVQEQLPKDQDEAEKQARKGLEEMANEMHKQADELRKSAEKDLEYDIDKHMNQHLEKLSRQVEELSRKARQSARNKSLSASELAKQIKEMKDQLAREKQEAEQNTTKPLEQLAQVQPLLEDSSRFVILAQKQKALAERMKSLDGKERPDDPAAKARMRDLQDEQQRVHEELNRLLDDIEEHAGRLPDQPDEFAKLKAEAQDFAQKVRESAADEAMADGETGFSEFSGTRGYNGAKKAGDILDGFVKKGEGMGQSCKGCLKFQPQLSTGLGGTCEQLLAEAGLLPGQGEQSGNGIGNGGGMSARRNSLENVGLYGGLPSIRESAGGGLSNRKRDGRTDPRANAAMPGRAQPGANAQPGTATGPVEAQIPAAYRKRVAEYFQRIADEAGTTPAPKK